MGGGGSREGEEVERLAKGAIHRLSPEGADRDGVGKGAGKRDSSAGRKSGHRWHLPGKYIRKKERKTAYQL